MNIRYSFALTLLLLITPNLAFAQASKNLIIGVGTHMGQNRLTAAQATPLISQAGADSFRDEIYWHRIEPEKGVLTFPDRYNNIDAVATHLSKSGGKPIIVLVYGNKFYDEGDTVQSEEAIQAFARYAKFVARHFKGRVTLFEVWNEWNIGLGSNKRPKTMRSVETYIRLLKATATAIKQEVPEATVIGGSVAGPDDRWIQKFIDLGGLDAGDALSLHPYFYDRPGKNKPEDSIEWVQELNAKILKAHKKSVPLYLTELGWPNHHAKKYSSPTQTSDYLMRFFLQAKALPYVKGVWWYELVNGGTDMNEKEHNFGMTEANFAPKPALGAMATISRLFKRTTSIKINRPDENIYHADIELGSKGKCLAWWTKQDTEHTKPPPATFNNTVWGDFKAQQDKLEINETPLIVCNIKI